MNTLIVAQTIFYLSVSLAIIALGVLSAIATYYIIHIARHLNNLSNNLDNTSEEIKENVREIIERLSQLPFLSFFLKRENSRERHFKKGRIKS